MYKLNQWTKNDSYYSSKIAGSYFGVKKSLISTACGEEIRTACGEEVSTACGEERFATACGEEVSTACGEERFVVRRDLLLLVVRKLVLLAARKGFPPLVEKSAQHVELI